MTFIEADSSSQNGELGHGSDSSLPIVAVLLTRSMREQILSSDALAQLADVCEIRTVANDALSQDQLPDLVDGAVACLTGWGTPPLERDLIEKMPSLRFIAHTAGSVRKLLPITEIGRKIRVSHAAEVMADAVAEFVIGTALVALQGLDQVDSEMRNGGDWYDLRSRFPGKLLGAQTVGIIGVGYVGRTVIRILKPFGSRILVSDPYLTSDKADTMGVEQVKLEQLLSSSDIVSLHAPVLPETRGMIGANEFSLLKDGSLFINSARSALIDEAALLEELKTGRIHAVLDVFDTEPLPTDSPFRTVQGARIYPHIAGHSVETHQRQGQVMVDEVMRFLRGDPLKHEVTKSMVATMA